MNMNVVYYFIVYIELCNFNAKSLPYVKDYARWRLIGALIAKITW